MNQEYTRQTPLTLSGGGSSARLLKDSELSATERRRKDAESEATDSRYIDMLCQRYRDRGIASKVHADAARQKKKEALDRAIAPGAYVMTEKLSGKEKPNRYRSGVADGKRFMTVDDFDRYYHDQRGYRFPQYRASTVTSTRRNPAELSAEQMAEAVDAGEVLLPKKAGWLTDTDKCPALVRKLLKYRFFQRLNQWAGETFPRETEVVRAKRKAQPFPVGMTVALAIVAVSMSMVISSTVLVSQSTREVSELKDKLAERQEILGDLSDELDLKNDLLGIEDKAVNALGMVGEKYVSGAYLEGDAQDYLEVYGNGSQADREDEEKSGWAAILSAFGIGRD